MNAVVGIVERRAVIVRKPDGGMRTNRHAAVKASARLRSI